MTALTKEQAQDYQNRHTMMGIGLVIWSVTTGTLDFGTRYVARPILAPNLHPRPEDGYLIADTLDTLRQLLPHGLTLLSRYPTDDPVIVETWL